MSSTTRAAAPAWVMVTVWSLTVAVALIGVALAVVTSSWWPLITLAGLAVPMMPLGSARGSARRAPATPR